MKIIEPGHVYELNSLDGGPPETLTFVNREEGREHPGTQTQEVLRALIDRTMHCDNCRRWGSNDKIIHHLRMALALHESRAIERKAEEGKFDAEHVMIGNDGHFQFAENNYIVQSDGISDAEIYLRKDKNEAAEGKPAKFDKMFCTRD